MEVAEKIEEKKKNGLNRDGEMEEEDEEEMEEEDEEETEEEEENEMAVFVMTSNEDLASEVLLANFYIKV